MHCFGTRGCSWAAAHHDGLYFLAIADDADMKIIADTIGLGALENEILQSRLIASATPSHFFFPGCPPNGPDIGSRI